jgi:chorismate mutase
MKLISERMEVVQKIAKERVSGLFSVVIHLIGP